MHYKLRIYKLFGNIYIFVCDVNTQDNLAEWLRRETRNLMGSARAGSNPAVVDSKYLLHKKKLSFVIFAKEKKQFFSYPPWFFGFIIFAEKKAVVDKILLVWFLYMLVLIGTNKGGWINTKKKTSLPLHVYQRRNKYIWNDVRNYFWSNEEYISHICSLK